MASQLKRPPFDPGFKNAGGYPNPGKVFDVEALRKGMSASGINATSIATKHPQYTHTDITVPGIPGLSSYSPTLALYQTSPQETAKKYPTGRPVIYHIHGGGQIAGSRFFGLEFPMSHFPPSSNILFASPEYRLAPDHPAPAAVHDVYAGLVYLATHAAALDIDPAKIIIYGISGGAAIAASTCLLARKLGGPKCLAQVLDSPMLDDRHALYKSQQQFYEGTTWAGWLDEQAWNAVLGAASERADPDGVRVAGRADSLAGLPQAFVDVGACESLRDAAVAFATRIWSEGGEAELHVWPGVYHSGALFEQDVRVGRQMVRARTGFLERVLGEGEDEERKAVF